MPCEVAAEQLDVRSKAGVVAVAGEDLRERVDLHRLRGQPRLARLQIELHPLAQGVDPVINRRERAEVLERLAPLGRIQLLRRAKHRGLLHERDRRDQKDPRDIDVRAHRLVALELPALELLDLRGNRVEIRNDLFREQLELGLPGLFRGFFLHDRHIHGI